MVLQTLEAIKGGGGSVKVGTTGKIGALMTRELNSLNSAHQESASSENKPPTEPVSAHCGVTSPRILKMKKSLDEASSSSSSSTDGGSPGIPQKAKGYGNKTHRIPMLGSDNIAAIGTPTRPKASRGIVEVVDIRCRNTERAWAKPLKNRLKKLNFSKLSETIA